MSDFEKQVQDLLTAAMQHPGAAEAARVFEAQRPYIESYNAVASAMSTRVVQTVATSAAATVKLG